MDSLFPTPHTQPPAPVAVARVYLDNDLPHLDKLFDYEIPEKLNVQPGMLVRVRFAGKLFSAWVAEVVSESEFTGKLQPIERVISPQILASKTLLALAKDLAVRNCVPVAKMLSAMIPPRHAGGEKAGLKLLAAAQEAAESAENSAPRAVPALPAAPAPQVLSASPQLETVHIQEAASPEPYPGLASLQTRLAQGEPLRAIWQLIPTDFPTRDYYAQSSLLTTIYQWATALKDQTILVIVPTQREITQFLNGFAKLQEQSGTQLPIASISSSDSPAERFEKFIAAAGGIYRVVVGTRSTTYQSVPHLAGIVIFDDGDTRHQDPQSPYLSSLDISLRRSHLERCTLLVAGAAPSVQATALAESGWAHWLAPTPQALRAATAVVQVVDQFERDRQGSAGKGRLPAFIQTKIRKALTRGPVLASVPRRGWISIIRCQNCTHTARCIHCQGPIRVSAQGTLSCAWCADPQYNWQCHNCQAKRWEPARLGSERTFEELGRAFPSVKIIQADSQHTAYDLPANTPNLVVATPGAEPIVAGGYAQIVVLDGEAVANRPELWAPEEAMRRWMRLLGFVRAGGELTILGISDPAFAQALIRKDPLGWARHTLKQRSDVGFYPAQALIAIDGAHPSVADFQQELGEILQKTGVEVETLGTAPRLGKDVPKVFGPQPTRLLLRSTWAQLPPLLEVIRQLQSSRSLKKQGLVTIRLNPRDLL
ncbi:MAG: hypothetical protein Q4D73_01490 [Actinomycetaceae bacterium]|nr:hypothetical protein [Actinomycetaceae bacterium]